MRSLCKGFRSGMFAATALCALTLLTGAAAAQSTDIPPVPLIRVETGMHAGAVRRVLFDAPSNRVFSMGDDKVVRVWQLPEGRLAGVLRPPIGAGHEGRMFSISASSDGKWLAAGGWTGWEWDRKGSVYVFDIASGEVLRRIADLPEIVGAVKFSKDGRYLAVGLQTQGGLKVFRTSDWSQIAEDKAYNDKILAMDFAADGRLVVGSIDGFLRIYDAAFKLIGRKQSAPGKMTMSVKVSPDSGRVAVAFDDVNTIAVYSMTDFKQLFSTDVEGLVGQTRMSDAAWSDDGAALYGCGENIGAGKNFVYRWGKGGRGRREALAAGTAQRISDVQTMPGGGVMFSAEDPIIGAMDAQGREKFRIGPDIASFRDAGDSLRTSDDAGVVEFPLASGGQRRARFSLADRRMVAADDAARLPPQRVPAAGFSVEGWKDATAPRLNGAALKLDDYEISRSHAVDRNATTLVLGTEWAIRAYDRASKQLWKTEITGVAWNVAVSGDGRAVIATLGDGTIRWYRIEDGVEYLALFPHGAGEEWVAFTPTGYYLSSNYGDNFVGWHVNRGKDKAADFYRAVQFERILYRPDVVEASLSSRGHAPVLAARDVEVFNIKDLALIAPPRIRIGAMTPSTAPDGTARLKVAFEVEKNSLPMRDYAVYVNNIPVTPAKERRLSSREDGRFGREIEFDLQARDSVVRIEVTNGRSVGLAEKHFALQGAAITRQAPGELYLLAVGANHFPKLNGADLAYAARDAEQLEKFFAADAGKQYSRVNTRVLSDLSPVKPERAKILEALEFISAAGPRDTVIVFLASHGISDAAGNYYFVTRDATPEDVDAVIKGGERKITSMIGWATFFDALRGVAGRRLLIVDTCQAKNIEGKLDVHSLSKRSASSLFSLVVASKGNEESQEYPPGQHGLFTYAMLNGLRGPGDINRDGVITLNEMFGAATPVVDQLRNKVLGPQTPQLLAPEPLGNMVLVRTSGAAIPAPAVTQPIGNAACGVRTLLVGARDPRCTSDFGERDSAPHRPANTGCGVRNLVIGSRDPNCTP